MTEIINEKQIFGQEKQFQKDEGITKVDELQSETTDAIKAKASAGSSVDILISVMEIT